MKKLIIGLILIALGIAGYLHFKKAEAPVTYKETKPYRGSITVEFRQTGTVSPRNRLEIMPPVSGRIEEILTNEGQKVKKGQTIVKISSTERAALLDAARSKGASEVKKWESIYKPTPIVAPLDGFIIARSKEPGQTVGTGDAILVMADELIVEGTVDETDLRYISLGQTLSMSLDAYPDNKFKGIVEHIAFESEVVNNVTVYTIKIKPVNPPAEFRAGMTATISIESVSRNDLLLLPSSVIISSGTAKAVLVRNDMGEAESRLIETGLVNSTETEIVSGITENDTVLTAVNGPRKKKKVNGGIMMPGMGGKNNKRMGPPH